MPSRDTPSARELWDADDEARQRHAEALWLERMRAAIARSPRISLSQGIYTVTTPVAQLDFDQLVTDRRTSETHAELTVYLTDPVNLGKLLHKGRLNLLSSDRRERLARYLGSRTKDLEIDWAELLEEACVAVLGHYRAGEPAVLLRDVEVPPGAGQPLVAPLLAPDGSTILFGDGGAAKSLTALALATSLHAGEEVIRGMPPAFRRRVAYLDWEWSGYVHRRRLERLWGDRGELPDLVYAECRLSLRDERDRLRRIIRDHGIEYLVIDSVGLACGGDPQLPEVALGFFSSLRELGLDALLVAHVTKDQRRQATHRPFGSTYWHNSARSTWYAKAQRDPAEDRLTIGVFNRKSNDARLEAPLAIRVDFREHTIAMERSGVAAQGDLAKELPLRLRMIDVLRTGARTLQEIVDELDANVEGVRKVIQRDGGRRFVKVTAADGTSRYGLAQQEAGL